MKALTEPSALQVLHICRRQPYINSLLTPCGAHPNDLIGRFCRLAVSLQLSALPAVGTWHPAVVSLQRSGLHLIGLVLA